MNNFQAYSVKKFIKAITVESTPHVPSRLNGPFSGNFASLNWSGQGSSREEAFLHKAKAGDKEAWQPVDS